VAVTFAHSINMYYYMEKEFQCNNANIYYRTRGSGPVVVLLHGFAEDGTVWDQQVEYLEQYCTLLVPDLPGSGRSSTLNQETVKMEDYANCINSLLINEKVGSCILLGHSMGGYITLAFAEMFPDKLAGIGFVHSTAFADNEEKKSNRQKGIKLIEQYGVYPFVKNSTPNLFSESYKKQHADKVNELVEQGKQFSKEALVQYYRAMIDRPDRTAVLEKSRVPVLFIIGTEDVAAPLQDLLQQVHLPNTSYIHILPGVVHMGMWEKPKEVNEHLLEFIKNCSPQTPD
jgi:pimeloyl-ACP methyl ester carboxylesterase